MADVRGLGRRRDRPSQWAAPDSTPVFALSSPRGRQASVPLQHLWRVFRGLSLCYRLSIDDLTCDSRSSIRRRRAHAFLPLQESSAISTQRRRRRRLATLRAPAISGLVHGLDTLNRVDCFQAASARSLYRRLEFARPPCPNRLTRFRHSDSSRLRLPNSNHHERRQDCSCRALNKRSTQQPENCARSLTETSASPTEPAA